MKKHLFYIGIVGTISLFTASCTLTSEEIQKTIRSEDATLTELVEKELEKLDKKGTEYSVRFIAPDHDSYVCQNIKCPDKMAIVEFPESPELASAYFISENLYGEGRAPVNIHSLKKDDRYFPFFVRISNPTEDIKSVKIIDENLDREPERVRVDYNCRNCFSLENFKNIFANSKIIEYFGNSTLIRYFNSNTGFFGDKKDSKGIFAKATDADKKEFYEHSRTYGLLTNFTEKQLTAYNYTKIARNN